MSSWLLFATALASALMGGVFFAFSSFIMPALGRIPPEDGIRAMQRINIDVLHWSFLVPFVGTPIACVALAAQAIWHWNEPGAIYCVVGGAVYLFGTFIVTAAGNVPLNNALAKVKADAVDAARAWDEFAIGWTRWNHVRTVASMAAAGAFAAALATA
ncbi:MAG: DUF1772 domain-containing protein [Myxococcales bacterium]|nr:DUF1772 domain-containing protein [Myxococcales bacterium]MDH3483423.1 DUF1772 domain-containing protein [Myxococcales bacterium]